MCPATMALTLLVATCEPVSIDTARLNVPAAQYASTVKRLDDPSLARIRGGSGYLVKVGKNGVARLVQDGNTRDMTLPLAAATQITDTWWSEIGSAYIAVSLSR